MDKQGKVATALLDNEDEILSMIKQLFPKPDGCFYIQEKVEEIEGIKRGYPSQLWSRGRVFSERLELRWQRTGQGKLKVQLLGEENFPEADVFELADNSWDVTEEKKIILWGNKKEGEETPYWIEVKVPRGLNYPVEKGKTAAIIALDYLSPRGTVQYTRFKGVKAL
jgi:hypothetical protein